MNALAIQPERPSREFAIGLLNGGFRQAAESLPEDLAKLTEMELEDIRKPTETDFFLRKNFWKHVDMAKNGLIAEIRAVDIYSGICSKQNFENRVLGEPNRVAWLLIYPSTPNEMMEAGLSLGLKNLIKFISHEPDSLTAGAFIKAMEMLLNRVQGPVIQKIQAQHAHLNLNKPLAPKPNNERLEELKSKLVPRDVTPVKNE